MGSAFKRMAAVLLLTVALVASTAGVAQAANRDGHCDYLEFCGWRYDAYSGEISDMFFSVNNYTVEPYAHFVNSSVTLNDRISSAKNLDDTFYVRLYLHINYGGNSYLFLRYGDPCNQFACWYSAKLPAYINDNSSSHQFSYSTT